MALRNVPKSYTFDQQRQEINDLAVDVGDITQLASGLPSVVAAINTLQAGSADGGELLSGPAAPTAGDGANGDFWLDTSTNDLYGPKENGAWPATTVSFSEQILSALISISCCFYTLLCLIQRGYCCYLYRLENSIIKITFHPS